jgi:hypothetical protein
MEGSDDKFSINKEAMISHLSERYRNHSYKKIIEAFDKVKL